MSKHATADFRQNRFKSHHHFVLENENFTQNPLIQPTQFKALSRSCCLRYRRQIFPSFVVPLSFKMKCMTHFLSLAHTNSFLKICVQMNDAEITQNATFVLILIYIHWHSKWNTLPVCRKLVMLYLLLFCASKCNYTFNYLKWGLKILQWDLSFLTPGKWFVSGFSQYVTEMLNYPRASPQTPNDRLKLTRR